MNRSILLRLAAFLGALGIIFCVVGVDGQRIGPSAHAQFFNPVPYFPTGGGGGGCGGSQWNAGDAGADIVLTGSPCKLTYSGGHPSLFEIVRSTSSHSGTSTSYYVEVTIGSLCGGCNPVFGFADASETLGPSGSSYCGASTHSVGYQPYSGSVLYNGSVAATIFTATAGDVIGMIADMAGIDGAPWEALFNKNGGTFLGAATLTGTPGGTVFVCGMDINNLATATVNFTATPPASHSAWN
jgi:hypothetical protein